MFTISFLLVYLSVRLVVALVLDGGFAVERNKEGFYGCQQVQMSSRYMCLIMFLLMCMDVG